MQPGRQTTRDDETELDWSTIRHINRYHRHGVWPQVCRVGMHKMILNKEPTFTRGKETHTTAELQPRFRDVVRDYWVPFTALCTDELLVGGAVVFEYHITDEDDYVPVILPSEEGGVEHGVTIRRDRKHMRNIYTVYTLKDENGRALPVPKVRPGARVLTDNGFEPSLDGTINSRLFPLLAIESFYAQIRKFALDTEYNLARPPLVFECDPAAASNMKAAETSLPYANANRERARADGTMLFTQRRDPNVIPHFISKVNKMTINAKAQLTSTDAGGVLTATPFFVDNMLFLPEGISPANTVVPVRMPNYDKHMDNYVNEVCAVYGLSRSLFIQDVANRGTGNTVLTSETLRHTIMELIHTISLILTRVHEDLYGEHDHLIEAEKMMRKKRHLSSPDFFKVVRDVAEVHVTLPAPPTTDHDMLERLYALKVITWPKFYESMLAISGLPASDVPPEPTVDELTKRLAMIQGQRADPKPDAMAKPKTALAKSKSKAKSETKKSKSATSTKTTST